MGERKGGWGIVRMGMGVVVGLMVRATKIEPSSFVLRKSVCAHRQNGCSKIVYSRSHKYSDGQDQTVLKK